MNTPDDYNTFWQVCPECGHRWHPAEEFCECEDEDVYEVGDSVTYYMYGRRTVAEIIDVAFDGIATDCEEDFIFFSEFEKLDVQKEE